MQEQTRHVLAQYLLIKRAILRTLREETLTNPRLDVLVIRRGLRLLLLDRRSDTALFQLLGLIRRTTQRVDTLVI